MFRFTIRDVLWLTVVVGLAIGWWLTGRRLSDVDAKRQVLQSKVDSIKQLMAKARMDEQFRRAYDGSPRR